MSRIALITAVTLLAVTPAQAEGWKHEFAPYMWFAAMDGKVGVRDVTADVDVSFSDIWDNLQFGAMGAYIGRKDRFFVQADAIYMDLDADKTGPNGLVFGDVSGHQTAIEGDFGYSVNDRFDVFAGVRYNKLHSDVSVTGPLNNKRTAAGSEDWYDPVVGARYMHPFHEKWSVALRGDIGGFGVGSDLAWQAIASLRWQVSEHVGVGAAYRYFQMDYKDGNSGAAGYFKYDVATSGPALGAVFTF